MHGEDAVYTEAVQGEEWSHKSIIDYNMRDLLLLLNVSWLTSGDAN